MNAEQSGRLALAFARETARSTTARLCAACVEVLQVTGAGITIMGGDQAGPICVSDPSVAALEDLQYTIGEGPCRDAFQTRRIGARAADWTMGASARWPSFVDLAQASGIGAVFAYPLLAAGVEGRRADDLPAHGGSAHAAAQHDDSLAVAEVLTETVLSLQDDAPAGTLAAGLDDAVAYRAEIYQASGMVAIQLSIPTAEALVRIRAHAFANDRTSPRSPPTSSSRRLRLPNDRHPEKEV